MHDIHHRYADIGGRQLFYREAGPAGAPAVVLLHGFPASSFMFRHLIPRLADRYRVIAPDHLGFGLSGAPPAAEFGYTFDALGERLGTAKITVGTMGAAITNAAAGTLARSLALELAPIRVNAISPGVIDTGAWDALGAQGKAGYFAGISARNPARRIGTANDIANGVPFAPDQHLPHRPDPAHRRQRAAHLTPPCPGPHPPVRNPERKRQWA